MRDLFIRLVKDEQGTEVVEWALVAGFIIIGAIVAISALGTKVSTAWTNLNNGFTPVP